MHYIVLHLYIGARESNVHPLTQRTMSKRNANYLLNMTADERDYLHKQAKLNDLSLAAYIRLNLLAGADLTASA